MDAFTDERKFDSRIVTGETGQNQKFPVEPDADDSSGMQFLPGSRIKYGAGEIGRMTKTVVWTLMSNLRGQHRD